MIYVRSKPRLNIRSCSIIIVASVILQTFLIVAAAFNQVNMVTTHAVSTIQKPGSFMVQTIPFIIKYGST